MNIEINQEFKALIPPLSIEEYSQLEKNIIADGCREPLDSVMSTIDKTKHNTRDTIANDLGWSTGKGCNGKV
jgi:hypothetical protein